MARPTGLGDDHTPLTTRGLHQTDHAAKVGCGHVDVGALPERIAVRQQHVACSGECGAFKELVVGINATHRDVLRQRSPDALDVRQQLGLGQFPAQQHLVADHCNVDQTRLGQREQTGDLAFVAIAVGTDPGAYHRLEPVFTGQPGNHLVPLAAGERTHPSCVGCDERDPPAHLCLGQLVARALSLGVCAEAQAVHTRAQLFGIHRADVGGRLARQSRALHGWQVKTVVFQPGASARALGRRRCTAPLASLELCVHFDGARFIQVVVAHEPHRQQRADDGHAGVEKPQTVNRTVRLHRSSRGEGNPRHDGPTEQAGHSKAKLHHPPIDGPKDALASLAGGQLVQVANVGCH